MYLLRGKIHTDLEDYARAKSDYTECKKYEPHNPRIKRNLRKVNKLIDERPPYKKDADHYNTCGGCLLIVSFLAYRKKIIKPPQFTIFAPLCLAFCYVGYYPSVNQNYKNRAILKWNFKNLKSQFDQRWSGDGPRANLETRESVGQGL